MTNTKQVADDTYLAAAAEKRKHDIDIVVNGEPAVVLNDIVTYEQVVDIASEGPVDPNTTYTVTYRSAKSRPHEGELAAGESTTVKKKGTSFDVYPTGKS